MHTVYASFIIAVIQNSRNYLKIIKRNIKKQKNLRSTATVPRKLCVKYFVFYLKISCPYNLMLNCLNQCREGSPSNFAKLN